MEDGFKYLFTIQGVLKFLSVGFSCTTFALFAASGHYAYNSSTKWVLAAYIIAFSISFLFMFFRVIGLSARMQCGGPCSFDGFDFLWAWFCTGWCFAASIGFTSNFQSWWDDAEVIVSIVFAYVTWVIYAIEAFYLRQYAPANFGFVATKHGWVKTLIVVFGACAFGLLLDSGYPDACKDRRGGCIEGLTYSLVAFTVSWSVTTLLWIAHLVAPKGRMEGSDKLKKAEIVWAILGILLFWSGASVFAAYMSKDCDSYPEGHPCQKRLSGVIAGFLTGLLYLIEVIVLK